MRALLAISSRFVTLDNFLQVIGAICGLTGTYLINSGKAEGFFFWIVSNVLLIWLQCRTRLWALVGLHATYLFLCFDGLMRWHERSPESIPAWIPSSMFQILKHTF